jgi:UDP-GlcNAc:undecaprenyl-phosphate GlcNAc-1-phosphate transferase
MLNLALIIVISFFVVYYTIPPIIFIARDKKLFDAPSEERKIHKENVPTLGGVAIFGSFLFTSVLFLNNEIFLGSNFLMAACIILFATGLKDDLHSLTPYKKIGAQLAAAFLVVFFADIRLSSMYGILGVFDLPALFSIILSVFTILVITNAFNLIDGIDGLATSIGIVVSATYGYVFFLMDQNGLAITAFALTGSLIGFLIYNMSPARIFMGDTGAYLIGFITTILTLKFIELNKFDGLFNPNPFIKAAPSVAIGIVIVPLFDTLRVFMIRVVNKRSPFSADRNHLHHRLLDIGLSHRGAMLFLVMMNLLYIFMVFSLQSLGSSNLFMLIFAISILLHFVLDMVWKQRMKHQSPAH